MNGYFQLVITEQMTALKLMPPKGGEQISMNELMEYLHTHKIDDVDLKRLNAAICSLQEERIFPLMANSIHRVNETFALRVSPDGMEAVARFYPPSTGGKTMEKQEIISDLNLKKVIYGIDEGAIDRFFANRSYCTDIVLARGKAPVQGTDGRIEYFFNTDLNTKPKRNADGSVDFFNLNTINHCREGELLARMIKPKMGEAGKNVFGETINPHEVKRAALKYGRNITLSEDGTELFSQVNGHVSLVEQKVFVSDVYEVENVGTATGNIVSEGSVQVNGNVQSGFSIEAKGNVHVYGVVEGAVIVAGGDIIINRGMNGMGKGSLQAGGRIIAKFLENATASSGDYVEADSILHSKVSAKTEINVDGRKGFIIGGFAKATNKITCRTLGSSMGADTYVEVGADPAIKARYQKLQAEIVEIQQSIKKVQPILANATKKMKSGVKLTPEEMKYIQTLALANKQNQERLVQAQAELEGIESLLGHKGNACICIKDEAYAGTKVIISEASLVLKNTLKFCRLINDKGDVRVAAF